MEEEITLETGYVDSHQWFNTIKADANTFKDRPIIYSEFMRMAQKAGIENPILCVSDYMGGVQAAAFPDNRIVISREALKILTDREAVAVLGHEIGHAKNFAKHDFLNDHAAKIGAASGVAAAGIVSAALWHCASRRGTDKDKKPLSRRGFLIRAGGALTAISTAGLIGKKKGHSYGQEAPEFDADNVAISLGVPQEDLASAFKKIVQWYEKEGRSPGHIMQKRLSHWSR